MTRRSVSIQLVSQMKIRPKLESQTLSPLDRTTNFVHGFPFCCISLSLIYQKRAVLGVVYNPFLDYLVRGLVVPSSPHGDVSAVYSDRRPRILFHPRLWPTNEATIGRSETPHFPVQGAYWCVPHLLHIRSIIPTIVGVEWGSDRTTPAIELKCEVYLRLASDPATVEHGRMVHSLRTTGCGALNFCLVAQGAIDICR